MGGRREAKRRGLMASLILGLGVGGCGQAQGGALEGAEAVVEITSGMEVEVFDVSDPNGRAPGGARGREVRLRAELGWVAREWERPGMRHLCTTPCRVELPVGNYDLWGSVEGRPLRIGDGIDVRRSQRLTLDYRYDPLPLVLGPLSIGAGGFLIVAGATGLQFSEDAGSAAALVAGVGLAVTGLVVLAVELSEGRRIFVQREWLDPDARVGVE